jgi:hypothetical protein
MCTVFVSVQRGDSPLGVACGAGCLPLAKMLVAHGAEVNTANKVPTLCPLLPYMYTCVC